MNPATGPHGTPRKRPAATAETTTEETTEDRLRRELSQSITGRHTNSGLHGRNDMWGFSGIKGEESRVETAKTLKLVSKCFRLALKKNVIRLNARLKGYKDHEAMLAGKYALARRVWEEDPYHDY